MGLHKLEIEVDDEMLSMIDSVSTNTNHSRAEVVLKTQKERLVEILAERERLESHLAFLREIEKAGSHSSNLSSEEILRELREARGDE
ncbi:hypothetical protein PMI07_004171 [Rhizobium sp. CF080]|uniref:hypothetical protein n=1 Tax=Rhizobium sp. (strain CF080) TaxID=1144310 RepID=UPI0002715F14|nr:hypothetical protein [Rhizobium sp. CF080]EUC00885.1 hypothetical protein PMI07_004171 [Rhizobium sp. CF080]